MKYLVALGSEKVLIRTLKLWLHCLCENWLQTVNRILSDCPTYTYTREIHMKTWQHSKKPHLWTEEKLTNTNKTVCWPVNSYSPPSLLFHPTFSTQVPNQTWIAVCHSCWTHLPIQFSRELSQCQHPKGEQRELPASGGRLWSLWFHHWSDHNRNWNSWPLTSKHSLGPTIVRSISISIQSKTNYTARSDSINH